MERMKKREEKRRKDFYSFWEENKETKRKQFQMVRI